LSAVGTYIVHTLKVLFDRTHDRRCNVFHINEVSGLKTVLVYDWCLATQNVVGKVREHSCVWIVECLTGPVHVEKPERHGRGAHERRQQHHKRLLVELRETVDARGTSGPFLADGFGRVRIPIDTHARRDHDLLWWRVHLCELPKEQRGVVGVAGHVAIRIRHGIRDAYLRGEMNHRVGCDVIEFLGSDPATRVREVHARNVRRRSVNARLENVDGEDVVTVFA